MEEQSSLSKQNTIFSKVEKNEKKMKNILLLIIIGVIISSSLLSLSFSYKSYKEVKSLMVKDIDSDEDKISYETVIVSYSNGSLLTCNENGCNNTVVNISNDGVDSVFLNISFVDVGGDASNYNYSVNFDGRNLRDNAPSTNMVVLKGIELKPGEKKEYNVLINSVDGFPHSNYQARIQIDLNSDKNVFLD